ncbi:hypothetical protein H072_7425 [Dactylellina haptotyla CBS 200.50]|uniref:CCCH zinc finger and SMR domain-containing protein n=1 Tax=Dactylellina haptotyla (strain CBS 200.50) TaxID=1284197 RepID=S8A7J1_DACHA|nr:hypothetical protein H072_7425 [Dactylellina haptotyla CBS 200.50]
MVLPDDVFDECVAILQNASLLEEEQTEQVEEVIKSRTGLSGAALEAQTLDVLWRHRAQVSPTSSPPPPRATIIRRSSPAPWQMAARTGTPIGTPPPGFAAVSLLNHATSSPFPSPRPSPLLPYSSPRIPHSPSLNAYEYATDVNTPDIYGDYGSENVAWLVADDNPINYLSSRGGLMQQDNLTPHDMLRSVLGEGRSDDEISAALETCGYDLSATLSMLMEREGMIISNNGNGFSPEIMRTPEVKYSHLSGEGMTIATGKNTNLSPAGGEYGRSPGRPTTPKVGVVCRFFLSTGSCLRADCRFSHDTSSTICKYWVMGSCLAGDTCIFSHDPSQSASKLIDQQRAITSTPPLLHFQDTNAFPALGGDHAGSPYNGRDTNNPTLSPPPGFRALNISRPNSRSQNRAPSPMIPSVDDTDAFPSLGSAGAGGGGYKNNKKHQNRRNNRSNLTDGITGSPGQGIPTGPASLADVVRMSPSPGPYGRGNNRFNNHMTNSPPPTFAVPGKHRNNRAGGGNYPLSAAAAAIPPPQQIPWLDTGNVMNKTYLKHRQTAIKHGQLRNKYLSAAAAAWARNDAKAAKSLSNKGQQEQAEMRKAHREAASAIYEQRQKALRSAAANGTASTVTVELFVDLHGLHPEEAVEYLERILLENQKATQVLYAITGTGHHSKNGKDKVQRSVRAFLDEWKYVYREFSAQGDRGGMGGILGIDPGSFDRNYVKDKKNGGEYKDKTNGEGEDVFGIEERSVGDGELAVGADGEVLRRRDDIVVKVKEGKKKKGKGNHGNGGDIASPAEESSDGGVDSKSEGNGVVSTKAGESLDSAAAPVEPAGE